jgi:tetratricopeptide (TPR) repeat protein
VQLLLEKSLESLFSDPVRGLELADLAVQVSAHLGEAYDPHWVWDLRAKAHAYVGNARRVLGEIRSSETAFRKAEDCLARSMTGNSETEAEVLCHKSSLRRDQCRFAEALDLLERAIALLGEEGKPEKLAEALLRKAKILEESGDLEGAISFLETTGNSLTTSPEKWLYSCARFNLMVCLMLAGRFEQARALLPEVRSLFADSAPSLNLLRLRWTEAMIQFGLGSVAEAERALREVQRDFLDCHAAYDAALVSMDLAILFAQQGRTQELKELALEIMPVFESREIHREAMACLIMFQGACEEERLTVDLARELAAILRREKRGSRIVGT